MESTKGMASLQPQAFYPPIVGPEPAQITCPYCQAYVTTTVKVKSTTKTHFMAVFLYCIGCCLCSCIPYCKDSCRNRNHYCPGCERYLGTYKS